MVASRAFFIMAAARCGVMPATPRSRAFSTFAGLMHKESSSHINDDVDKHKSDSLRKQKDGSGGGAHWKRELASDSEEAVRADKAAADESIETLQERTKRTAEGDRKQGSSRGEGM